MRKAPEGHYEATRFEAGDHVVVAQQNYASTEVEDRDRYRDHKIPLGTEVKLEDWDPADGTWNCKPIGTGTVDYVHEDCLEGVPVKGATQFEVAQAIASITGQPAPPMRPDQDPTVPFLQGYVVMGLTSDWRSGKLPLKVTNVEQLTGPDGTYLNHCTVITESGKRIRVTFEEDV